MSSSRPAATARARSTVIIDRLTVQFPDRDRPAVLDLSERVEQGDLVAITGPSGCGKTTLCRTIAGFVPGMMQADVQGDVRIGAMSSLHVDPARLAVRVGLVQQDPDAQICTLGVRQEVAFGPENLCLPVDEVRRRVDEAMRIVGIEDLAERQTPTLSGGEKQRLAIAAILAMEPDVLLLDEPTANLDPHGAKTIFDTLARLREREGRSLIVVEHRLAPLLPFGPRLWVMDGGRIVLRRPTRRREDLVALGLRSSWARRPPRPASRAGVRTALRGVSFRYGQRPVIDRLSFTASSGEIVGVIGPNGGGKTTLLRLLAGLESPQDGTVEKKKDLRIGMVFQHPHQQIFERSVRRELEIEGPLDEDHRARLLDEARLRGLDEAAPLSLSLGEQRRLTVTTALRTEPDLLLLDEPFIGQDRNNAAWMIGRILAARDRGAATILVSHDVPLLAGLCDRLLYLGADVIEGTPDEMFARLRGIGKDAFTPEYWEGQAGGGER